jgi:hypothetical protein
MRSISFPSKRRPAPSRSSQSTSRKDPSKRGAKRTYRAEFESFQPQDRESYLSLLERILRTLRGS